SKMLWILGNYSRFVRPGAIRVSATIEQEGNSGKPILISAYKKGSAVTLVVVNSNNQSVQMKLHINGGQISLTRGYVTSETSDLKAKKLKADQDEIDIAGRSVTTITGTLR